MYLEFRRFKDLGVSGLGVRGLGFRVWRFRIWGRGFKMFKLSKMRGFGFGVFRVSSVLSVCTAWAQDLEYLDMRLFRMRSRQDPCS